MGYSQKCYGETLYSVIATRGQLAFDKRRGIYETMDRT